MIDACEKRKPSYARRKIRVRVDVKNAETWEALGVRADRAVRRRVIAADDRRDATLPEEPLRLEVDDLVHLLGELVHARERLLELRVSFDAPARFDDFFGCGARLFVPRAELARLGEHRDAALVRLAYLGVEQIDLHRRVEDRARPFARARAIRRRRVPRDRHEDDTRLLGRVRKAVDSRVALGGRVRIECHGGSSTI